MGQLSEFLIVPSILVHRNTNETPKDSKNAVLRFLTLFVLEIFVPERVGEEVKADVCRTALEKPANASQMLTRNNQKGRSEGVKEGCLYKREGEAWE